MPEQYDFHVQQDGVVYSGASPACGVKAGYNVPLEPYWMGNRRYDFNVDGYAHYGMLPDLLQDLKNLGLSEKDFALLFSSAEDYLRTWEKAQRMSAPPPIGRFVPVSLDCHTYCRGLCPKSKNAGAP